MNIGEKWHHPSTLGAVCDRACFDVARSQTAPTGGQGGEDFYGAVFVAGSGQTQPSDGRRSSVIREIRLMSRFFIGLPFART